ncbi:multidrug effflux MFS transporter [Sandaracinobacteroides hominis]|uniref:multidrug effflux MFS transporter n=1 Tax=Sandaracinobacteroides hominis TaxID=2780086 RepID=UPI0018F5F0C1|nr:multidrug effflux MFS transporter [Sandaracinobacteroides hominis]
MPESPAASGLRNAGAARLTGGRLALLASLAALGALATNILLPAFPQIAQDLGVNVQELALSLTVFFAVFAIGQLFVGPLSDAIGRKPFVLGGLAVFGLGSLVCAFAESLPVLIAGRALQAAGACAASVLARAIARDLYHGAELTRALALVMIAMAAAPGFSPALGTLMTATLGWRSVFVLVAVVAGIVALCYRGGVGETLAPASRRSAHPGSTIRTYFGLARDARFIAPALAVSFVIGCLYSFFGAAPAIFLNSMQISATGLSLFFAMTVFVVFGSGLLASPLARRFSAARTGMAGVLLTLASGLWLLAQGGAPSPVPFMAAITLFLAGMGLVNPIGTAIALEPFGDRAGAASALLGFLQMGCAALGTVLVASIRLAPATSFAWIVACAATLASLMFAIAIRSELSAKRLARP